MHKLCLEEFTRKQQQWLPLVRETVGNMGEKRISLSIISLECFTKSLFYLVMINKCFNSLYEGAWSLDF